MPNNTDRSGRCYRCGQEGHTAGRCTAEVKCPVFSDRKLPANHRTGSKSCTPVHKGKRGVPLNKATAGPSAPVVAAPPAKSKKDAGEMAKKEEVWLPDTPLSKPAPNQEEPMERRTQRMRSKRKEEEKLPEGGAKKQRLREDMKDGDPAAMEITGTEPKEPAQDGL